MAALKRFESSAWETVDPGSSSACRARTAAEAPAVVSEADTDLAILPVHGDRPQAGRGIGGVPAGPDVVLVAVPRADDVQLIAEVIAEAALLVVQALDHPVHQRALAHRATEVRAAVLPGIQPAVETE